MTTKIEDIANDVRELVFVQQKIVTFSYIARQYGLDVPRAKEVLQEIVQELKKEERTDFVTSYYITGYAKGSDPKADLGDDDFLRYNVMEADLDELDEHKEKFFSVVDGVSLRSIRSSDILKRDKDLYAKPTASNEDVQETTQPAISKVENGDLKGKTPVSQEIKKEDVNEPRKQNGKASHSEIKTKSKEEKVIKEVKVEPRYVEVNKIDEQDDDEDEEVIVKRKKPKNSFLSDSPVKQENGTKRKSLDDEEDEVEQKPDVKKTKKNGTSKPNEVKVKDEVKSGKVDAKKEPAKKTPKSVNSSSSQQKRITDFFKR